MRARRATKNSKHPSKEQFASCDALRVLTSSSLILKTLLSFPPALGLSASLLLPVWPHPPSKTESRQGNGRRIVVRGDGASLVHAVKRAVRRHAEITIAREARFDHQRLHPVGPIVETQLDGQDVGDFKNGGREWFPQGTPEEVRVYDFLIKSLGKAALYGVYDLLQNQGWMSVGIDHDTAQFAVNSIRRWWNEMGQARFPRAKELLITADGGGSNSHRSRLWKVSLQELADELGMNLFVCHFPPGTSKWNKIEHRLFSFITKNWRARPLVSLEVIVNLIANTTTRTGLVVKAAIDTNPTAVQVGLQSTDPS